MDIKAELISVIQSLKPQIDPTKGDLELDEVSIKLSKILSENEGLSVIEYFISNLDCGKMPIYIADTLVSKSEVDAIIENIYKMKKMDVLGGVLKFYHLLFYDEKTIDFSNRYLVLKKINSLGVGKTETVVSTICVSCRDGFVGSIEKCSKCSGNNLFKIKEIYLKTQARKILENGQYLEIYVKQCLQGAGVELIGFDIGNKKAYTNVRYQIDGDQIEVDVHGISEPLTLLLCEVKTVAKVDVNEMRKMDGLYDKIIEKINSVAGRKFSFLKIFVITGLFDVNIPTRAYQRKKWELLDRDNILTLQENIKVIQKEL